MVDMRQRAQKEKTTDHSAGKMKHKKRSNLYMLNTTPLFITISLYLFVHCNVGSTSAVIQHHMYTVVEYKYIIFGALAIAFGAD